MGFGDQFLEAVKKPLKRLAGALISTKVCVTYKYTFLQKAIFSP
jgi:hypothetical protein